MVPAALGTQTIGSILRPASYCGVVGYKPSHGTLHTGGIHPLSATCDHLGVLASTLDDAWCTASQISLGVGSPGRGFLTGAAAKAPRARKPTRLIRLDTEGWSEIEEGMRAAFDETITRLTSRGVEVIGQHSDPAVADLERALHRGKASALAITAYEMRWPFEGYIARFGTRIGARIREIVREAASTTPKAYEALLSDRAAVQKLVNEVARHGDAFITLSSSGPAPVGLKDTGSRTFLSYASWLGLPAFSLPLLRMQGMPVGVQIFGPQGGDADLCTVAGWLMRPDATR
jgi:Asp-tRNA(Asn)/Glu-tRNA(Gln) amidotransferase A subunit family amidase